MAQFKKKNEGDANPSPRLFDVEVGHYAPTHSGCKTLSPHSVENSSLGTAQIDHFRLVEANVSYSTAVFLVESRP